ncbi:MAG: flagellar biosynthesis protein FlhA [SAR324 cluster bacterium]|nr:flagellar biosynthesis protein FlhA [SAR324 cluster bacterium]
MFKQLSFRKSIFNSELGLAIGVLGILLIMLVPIAPFLVDMLIAINITITIVILFVALYTIEPLDFSTFPSILLISTLFRLSLNIASTRLILLNGNTTDNAAGQIIKAFGSTIIGGDYIVGFIVFLILVLINFIVITKGAGRIAEVAARFALDAMPGKQMAIDADLNAGVINDKIAQDRRLKIQQESDFFGAMDGASKFVRGDAIAGLIITLINIVGGLVIGMLVYNMPIGKALSHFTILTIGDGLVTQIPALIVSTAAGITVSKAGRKNRLGLDFNIQVFGNYKILTAASIAVVSLTIIPDTPKFPFLLLGSLFLFLAWSNFRKQKAKLELAQAKAEEEQPGIEKTEDISNLLPLDTLGLELGYGLIPLVDSDQDGEMLERIKAIRRQVALDYGFVVPAVHIKDNLDLEAGHYSILIKGIEVGHGEMSLNHLLAMQAGEVDKELEGEKTLEPAFGLPAIWINDAEKENAQIAGYTVVDIPTVITTHLTEAIKTNAYEFLQRQDVQKLLDQTAIDQPKLVEDLVPNILSLGAVQRVLQGLLKEGISIRNIPTILETLSDYGAHTKVPDLLIEFVRQSLDKVITKQYINNEGVLTVMTLDYNMEKTIADSIKDTPQGSYLGLAPTKAQLIITTVEAALNQFQKTNSQPLILTSPKIRVHFKKLTERMIAGLVVLSHNEVPFDVRIENIGVINAPDELLQSPKIMTSGAA